MTANVNRDTKHRSTPFGIEEFMVTRRADARKKSPSAGRRPLMDSSLFRSITAAVVSAA